VLIPLKEEIQRVKESGVRSSGGRRKKKEGRRIVYYQLPITNYQ
jgi:hypothetical protein